MLLSSDFVEVHVSKFEANATASADDDEALFVDDEALFVWKDEAVDELRLE